MFKKILVVDDDPSILLVITTVLKKGGYPAVTAKDGLEAIEKINDEIPALILLDISMPKMNGLEVCRIVKGNPRTKHIPVLMVTAETDPVFQKRSLELGAGDYINKPFDTDELLRKVKEHIDEANLAQAP